NAIALAEADAEKPVEFLSMAKLIARSHHEKWNGSGYPDALVGDAIPIAARLMALADVFDALTCKRVYKPAFTFDNAYKIIVEGSGTHFDPDVVEAFIHDYDTFIAIAQAYAE
ncbi:MAG: HD domain-containing protein, partial [Betaproteobacteria bacterium]|nr:HD domain-containing protein [Betaproteobacteria bacterium]